jgi:hypothetical protein
MSRPLGDPSKCWQLSRKGLAAGIVFRKGGDVVAANRMLQADSAPRLTVDLHWLRQSNADSSTEPSLLNDLSGVLESLYRFLEADATRTLVLRSACWKGQELGSNIGRSPKLQLASNVAAG